MTHVPAPDVAYEGGVDVRGRPVAPADLEGENNRPYAGRIAVELEVDLGARLPDAGQAPRPLARADVGRAEIDGDGTVTLQGTEAAAIRGCGR